MVRKNINFIIFGGIMIDTSQITEIEQGIASNYNPDKIILFGSYATGKYTDQLWIES